MKQEDKQFLLKDLCARLPYGVKFLRESWNYEWDQELSVIEVLEDIDKDGYINNTKVYNIEDIQPYLRPMSSMTEEEEKEYAKIVVKSQDCSYENNESATTIVNDWYLSKGFDVRGLIPMGLALEAPEGMYMKGE